jgi:hypothetical protein
MAVAGPAEAGAATTAAEPNPNSPWITMEQGVLESWKKEMGIMSFSLPGSVKRPRAHTIASQRRNRRAADGLGRLSDDQAYSFS